MKEDIPVEYKTLLDKINKISNSFNSSIDRIKKAASIEIKNAYNRGYTDGESSVSGGTDKSQSTDNKLVLKTN